MIVTSYLANHRKIKANGLKVVSISRFSPTGVECIAEFAPSATLVANYKQGRINDLAYKEIYLQELNSLSRFLVESIVDRLRSENVALCCYCGKGKFCHRHILSQWLNKNFNLDIHEL